MALLIQAVTMKWRLKTLGGGWLKRSGWLKEYNPKKNHFAIAAKRALKKAAGLILR